MIARLSRLYLLFALLLVMQLGGLAHSLTHLHDLGEPESVCELCVAYNVFDHALSGAAPARLEPTQSAVSAPEARRPVLPRPLQAYWSRAPPLVV